MTERKPFDDPQELLASARADARALFAHVLPGAAALLDGLDPAKRAIAVLVIADRADPEGRLFSDRIIEGMNNVQPEDEIFFTAQPAGTVIHLYRALNREPPPSLLKRPEPGVTLVLVVAHGTHQVLFWRSRLAAGGKA